MTPDPKNELPDLPEDALPDLPELPELPELPDDEVKLMPEETAEKISVLPDMNKDIEEVPPSKEPAPIKPPKKPEPAPAPPREPSPAKPSEPTPLPQQPEPPPVTPPPNTQPGSTPMGRATASAALAGGAPIGTTPIAQAPAPDPTPEEIAAMQAAMAPPDPSTKRELDGPPGHLQKAALIAIVGGLLPWQSWGHGGPLTWAVGKVVLLLGAFLLWKSIDFRSGIKVPGFIAALGKIELKKKQVVDPKVAARRAARDTGPAKLEVPFPTVLHVVGLLLLVGGCLFPMFDGSFVGEGADTYRFKAVAELGMLAWAAGTWVHIYAYERWGAFNPIYPMIFIGLLVAGLQRAVESVTGGEGIQIIGFAGGAAVGIAGGMAAYTIVESMMQAKREGDAKKAAEIERRKSARARKS